MAVAVDFGFLIGFWWSLDRRVVLLWRYSTHAFSLLGFSLQHEKGRAASPW
jgi:hypothetical protein